MEYRILREEEIELPLFEKFIRRQAVEDCWRREEGKWVIRKDPFIDDWTKKDYIFLVDCLKNTVRTGGVVFGAFEDGALKGFASVEGQPFGSKNQYLDLTCLHASADMRRKGIGKKLLSLAARWAGEKGAEKLYISSHSAAETQAFYRGMGCVDTAEPRREHVETEPFDCQLELAVDAVGKTKIRQGGAGQ